jgi:hypothetical protein
MTMLATPSIALSRPNAISAIDPAMTPRDDRHAPSIANHTRLSHERSRVRRASRSHSWVPGGTTSGCPTAIGASWVATALAG